MDPVGIEPGSSRLQSGRSTIAPRHCVFETMNVRYSNDAKKASSKYSKSRSWTLKKRIVIIVTAFWDASYNYYFELFQHEWRKVLPKFKKQYKVKLESFWILSNLMKESYEYKAQCSSFICSTQRSNWSVYLLCFLNSARFAIYCIRSYDKVYWIFDINY